MILYDIKPELFPSQCCKYFQFILVLMTGADECTEAVDDFLFLVYYLPLLKVYEEYATYFYCLKLNLN